MLYRTLTMTILSVGLAWPGPATADEVRSERERMYDRYLELSSLVRGGEVTPHWLDDGSTFWYADGAPDRTVIYEVDPAAGTRSPLFDAERLREALEPLLGHGLPYRGLPFETFEFVGDARAAVEFTADDRRFRLELESYEIRRLPELSEAEKNRFVARIIRPATFPGFPPVRELLSPDRRFFALERDHDLWLRSTADGRAERLTRDGGEDFDWKVEQDDLWNGARWSPDGVRLAAIKEDRRAVPKEPVVHWLKTTPEVEWMPFAKAGQALPRTELWVIDVFSKRRVRIETGDEPDQYFHYLGWLPDGGEVLYLSASRDFKRVRVMAADPRSGASRQVLEEKQATFVKNLSINPGWTDLLTLLPESRRFLWTSERDGWDHLYLYDLDGRLIRRLTRGEFPVLRVISVDEKAGWVYFTAHAEARLYDTHLYRVPLAGGTIERLTEAPGHHAIAFSPSGAYFLDSHSSLDRPPRVELRAADGRHVMDLAEADVSRLAELHWRPPEEFVVQAADGTTDLSGILYKPWDFDPSRKYPVIEYVYAGPFRTWVPRTFSGSRHTGIYAQALAQLGFVTFLVDGRGTPERGKAFQDVVYKNFGRHEIPDHAAALRQLAAERPYMDLERVGIFGGSWGGYATVRAMLTAPETYHVGIATNPVYDFFDHGASGLEGYLGGTPQNNLDAYEQGSSLSLVDRLAGKLLLIHATSDVNASFSATMKMVAALVDANKPYDLVVLPEQSHHPQGRSRHYRFEAHRRYFQEHLRPGL